MQRTSVYLLRYLSPWVVPLVLALCWGYASHSGLMSAQILPSPWRVLDSAREVIPDDLAQALPVSLWRLAIGLLGGIFLGFIIGCLFGLSRRFSQWVMPLFTVLVQIPTLAWIPLLMLILGLGESLKLVILIKAITVPVALYTCAGIQQIPKSLKEMAQVLSLRPMTYLYRLALPSILPYLMTGIRLAFSQGWVSLIAVELLASSEGLGYLLVQSRQLFMLDIVYVCIIVIGLLGFAGERILLMLTQRWVYWPAPVVNGGSLTNVGTASLSGAVLPVALLLLWQVAAGYGWLDPVFFSSPLQVMHSLLLGVSDGGLATDLLISLKRMVQGFSIGALMGVSLGALTSRYSLFHRTLTPFCSALRSVALFAWLPLITAWAGLGEQSLIIFIALASFFPLFLATQQSIGQLPPTLVEVSRSLRLKLLSRLRYLILPGILLNMFTGFRLGLMHAWVATMGAEYFLSSTQGIGSMMMRAQQLLAADRIMSGIILIATVAALIAWGVNQLERRLTVWHYK